MKELVKEFQEKENPKRASLGSLGANQRINQLASPVKGNACNGQSSAVFRKAEESNNKVGVSLKSNSRAIGG